MIFTMHPTTDGSVIWLRDVSWETVLTLPFGSMVHWMTRSPSMPVWSLSAAS